MEELLLSLQSAEVLCARQKKYTRCDELKQALAELSSLLETVRALQGAEQAAAAAKDYAKAQELHKQEVMEAARMEEKASGYRVRFEDELTTATAAVAPMVASVPIMPADPPIGLVVDQSTALQQTITITILGLNGTFEGTTVNSVPHGHGIFRCNTSQGLTVKYVGEWSNGSMHGEGTQTQSRGGQVLQKYIGEFRNNVAAGQGTAIEKGKEYTGEFRDGK